MDLKYQPVDKTRWIDIVDSQYDHPEFIHLRLLKVVHGDVLNLALAQTKLQAYNFKSMILVASKLVLQARENRLIQLRKSKTSAQEIELLRDRIESISKRISEIERSRCRNRFMLFATRYHLINPERNRKYHWIHLAKGKNTRENLGVPHRQRTASLVWPSSTHR